MRLGSLAERGGFKLDHRAMVGSTNIEAMARGEDRLWVVADDQTAARGRRGRAWHSGAGNLFASILLRQPFDPRRVADLCLVAAVATADAIEVAAPAAAWQLRLKWPNDVLVGPAKVAGILIEGAPAPDGFAVVIGIGVNVAHHPEDTPYPAAHLQALDGGATATGLFAAMSDAFAVRLDDWGGGRGLADIRQRWLARAAGLGERITVRLPDRTLDGRFETLDQDGNLLLVDEFGHRRTLSAGEVFFAPTEQSRGQA